MFSAELSTHEGGDHVVVALRGELDIAEAASVAATLTEVAARGPIIIVDLEAVGFMDSSGVARWLADAGGPGTGGDLVLAAAKARSEDSRPDPWLMPSWATPAWTKRSSVPGRLAGVLTKAAAVSDQWLRLMVAVPR